MLGIFAGLVAATGFDTGHGKESLKPIGYVFVFVGYVALAFVTTYFLAALVHAANERLKGRDASFGDSIAAANAKLHRILPWALVQATVSIIIPSIEERAASFGRSSCACSARRGPSSRSSRSRSSCSRTSARGTR